MKKIVSLLMIISLLSVCIPVFAQTGFTAELVGFVNHIDIGADNSVTLKLKNPDKNPISVEIVSEIKTLSGELISDVTIPVTIKEKSSVYQPIALDIENGGEYTFCVSVYQGENQEASYEKYVYASKSITPYENIGICTHFDFDTFYNASDMSVLKNAGFSMIRDECRWQNVEKFKGKYVIPAHVFNYIEKAEKTNTEVLLMLSFNNTLYSENECDIPITEDNIKAFLEYVRYVVKTLKGRVKYFEIWNEPNHENFNRNNATAEQYVNLLKESYAVIKQENPEAFVVSGGTAGSSNAGDYIKEMVAAGALNYMDAFGIHPYCTKGAIVDERITVTYSSDIDFLINECGITKDIWIAEVGYSTHTEYYTDREKGAYNIRTMLEFMADGRVKKMFLYQLKDTERGEQYALLKSDGEAYESFKMVDAFGERVSNADFVKKWSEYYYSVYQFKDRTTNDDIFIMWSKKNTELNLGIKAASDGADTGFNYFQTKLTLDLGLNNAENKLYKYDAFGNKEEINVGSSLTLNYEPMYIVCEKPSQQSYCDITMEDNFIKGNGYISNSSEYVTVRAVGKRSKKTAYLSQMKPDNGVFSFSFKIPGNDVYEIYVYNGTNNYEKFNAGSVDVSYSATVGNTVVENINQLVKGDLIEAEAFIENNGYALGELIFVISVYAEDGKLLSVKTNSLTEEGKPTSKVSVDITADELKDWDSVKLFLWDKALVPVADSFEIK